MLFFFLRYWLITGLQKKQIQCVFCFLAFETKKKLKKITREHKQTTSFESKPNTILKVLSFLVSYQFWLFWNKQVMVVCMQYAEGIL